MEKNTDSGLASSEKNTGSLRPIHKKPRRFAVTAGRLTMTALLVAAVVSVAWPSYGRAATATLPSYNSATLSAGASPSAAAIGDLDGDGLKDIAVVNLQGNLQLFFNHGAGVFERVSFNSLWPAGSNTLDVAIGDLNGDGRNDLAVAFSTQKGSVSVLLNQGNRIFAAPVNYELCGASSGLAIGDLDGDGDMDIVDISQCSTAGVLLNNGQGSFTYKGAYGSGYGSRAVALGDFNGDGFKDVAYINNGLGMGKASNVTVMLNLGNGSFGADLWNYVGDGPNDLTIGDFDGDGSADLAIADEYFSEIWILFNNGSGTFNAGYSEFSGGDTPRRIISADFNGDGRLDLAVTSQGTNRLSLFINQGNYNFSAPIGFNVGQAPVDVAAGNLDGDALPDLVTVNQGSGTITVLFSAAGSPPPPPPPPQITLTVSTRIINKTRQVNLHWSGATGASVDVYRNGSRIATVSNNGNYTDQFNQRARGTYTYKICMAGGQTCSNNATISF